MKRFAAPLIVLSFALAPSISAGEAKAVTHTGWFSDADCAGPRVRKGTLGPNNRDCVQKCLAKGVRMVFVDETAGTMYEVENPDAARGQESHHVRVAGTLDADKGILHVASLQVLETYKATCQVPKGDAAH